MKPIISYADITVGAVFFNISLSEDKRADRVVIEAAQNRHQSDLARESYPLTLAWYLDAFKSTLITHEWCHILQAITYPALYLQCLRGFSLIETFLKELRENKNSSLPFQIPIPAAWREVLEAGTQVYRINIDPLGKYQIEPANTSLPRPSDLSETQLIEEDASIFQYKAEIGGAGTGKGYKQWLKERRRYTMAFKFLERLLGVENAYIAFQPLVRACFTTSSPMVAFASLISDILTESVELPTQLGIDDFYHFLLDRIGNSPSLLHECPDPYQLYQEGNHYYIDHAAFGHLLEYNNRHPLFLLAVSVWEFQAKNSSYPDWFFHPYRHFDREGILKSQDLQSYWPPITVYRLHHPSLSTSDAFLVIGSEFKNKALPFLPTLTYADYFPDLMEKKNLVFSMIPDYCESVPHNCQHVNCPVHQTNLCRRWMKIPDIPENCQFPGWFQSVTLHKINFENRTLERISR